MVKIISLNCMKKILLQFIMPFFLITSCAGLKKMEKKLQGNWVLTSVDLQPIELSQHIPTVKFDTKKKIISGTDGCNQYQSSFELNSKNKIGIAPLSKTKMMCIGAMDLAKQFSNYMQTVNSITFNDERVLILKTISNHQLIFKKNN